MSAYPAFPRAPKMPRLYRAVTVTEKLDGTNVLVHVTDDGRVFAGSKEAWLRPGEFDPFGWRAWVEAHAEELRHLGPGNHRGEWWGRGIQKRHSTHAKTFSLYNAGRWSKTAPTAATFDALAAHAAAVRSAEESGTQPPKAMPPMRPPECCDVVPVLYAGPFSEAAIQQCLDRLRRNGSVADPGNMRPEGVIVYHSAIEGLVACPACETEFQVAQSFKVTLDHDNQPKSTVAE